MSESMSESTGEYTREQIDALFEVEKPPYIKIRYSDGETGWAIDLDDKHAVISNTPLEPRLCLMDVVEKDPPSYEGTCLTAGKVVWRYYAKKTGVRYPAPDGETAEANWLKIRVAVREAGLGCEGIVAGSCGVSHHDDTDLAAVLSEGGLDMSTITLRTDWQ